MGSKGKDGGKMYLKSIWRTNLDHVFQLPWLFLHLSWEMLSKVGLSQMEEEIVSGVLDFFVLPLRPGTVQLLRCSFCGTWWNCGTCRTAACTLSPCWCITGSCKIKNQDQFENLQNAEPCEIIWHTCYRVVNVDFAYRDLNICKLEVDFFQIQWKSNPGSKYSTCKCNLQHVMKVDLKNFLSAKK